MPTGDILKWDGHTHGPYCHHGSDAAMADYIVRALELGFERITLTEHPPLPDGWLEDQAVQRTLAMPRADLARYLSDARAAKELFADQIDVRVGLEVDFLYNNEQFTWNLFEQSVPVIDEVIISVHFLPGIGGMRCIDLTAQDMTAGLLAYYGSMERLLEIYFEHQEQAIQLAKLFPVPARLGHATLIDKFRRDLPAYDPWLRSQHLERIFSLLLKNGLALDANTAGLTLSSCGTMYPPMEDVVAAWAMGVPCVFGSDAHAPEAIGRHYETYAQLPALAARR